MTMVWLWLAAVLVAPGQQDASGSVHVAVVNIPVVSEQYLRTAELEAHFENVRRRFNEQGDEMRAKLNRINKSLQEELKPGTDEYRERSKQLVALDAELKWFVETEGQKVEAGLATSLRTIFDDILAATREIAVERGIDVVLASDEMPNETSESATQVRQQILLQKVLYWSPRVDLTQEVIARVNANYRANSPGLPEGVPQPTGVAQPAQSTQPTDSGEPVR